MSYKGPSMVTDPTRRPRPSPGDRSGDVPVDALGYSGPSPPRHRAAAVFPGEPVPTGWTLVSEPSRLPLRGCVGRVLCPITTGPQGFRRTFFDVLLVPACPPPERRRRPQLRVIHPQACAQVSPTEPAALCGSGALRLRLKVEPSGSARPEEVLEVLGLRDLLADGAILARTDVALAEA